MENWSGLLNPIFIAWALWGLFLGLGAIFGARRLARRQLMTENSPTMYIVTGLLMIGMVVFAIALGGIGG
jgi:hypothetical protein